MCDCDCDCVSREEIDQILEEVSQLRDVQEKQAERIETLEAERDELGAENQRLTERVAELEADAAELDSKADDRDARMDAMSNWIENTNDAVDELEEDVATIDAESGQPSGPTADDGIDYEELTTVEKYSEIPTEERAEMLGASERRAVAIFEHWDSWADAVPAGDVLKTAELRPLLETACEEKLESKQILRAARALERLSEGTIVVDQSARAGYYRLLQPAKHEFASTQSAGGSSSPSPGVTASSA